MPERKSGLERVLGLIGPDLKTAEALANILMIPISMVDQVFGNMLYRKVQPSELYAMTYHELMYWNRWHKLMEDADRKAVEKIEKNK